MQSGYGSPIVHLVFLVIGIIFFIKILIDARNHKKDNAANEITLGAVVFLIILARVMVGLGLLSANGIVYIALGIQLAATIAILMLKPGKTKNNTSSLHQYLRAFNIVVGLVSIIALVVAGYMAYGLFDSTMPMSAVIILLGNIPVLVAVIYKCIQAYSYNKIS